MATYKGIQGYSVQKLSSDPTVEDTIGQLWYNSGSGKFKISVEGAGAWAAGNALNSPRESPSGTGIQTAALCAGGMMGPPASPRYRDETETYDGTTWTEVNDLLTGRTAMGAAGIITASLVFGGSTATPNVKGETEEWDGTCWTEQNDLLTDRWRCGGYGTTTAANCVGGQTPSPTSYYDVYETYDGTSWSEQNDINTARHNGIGGSGTTTAGLIYGGAVPGGTGESDATEEWDGTSWTTVNNLNEPKKSAGRAGTRTAAINYGGYDGSNLAINESWDGTSWTELADMGTARRENSGANSAPNTVALAFGGYDGSLTGATEEWIDPVYSAKTVTVW